MDERERCVPFQLFLAKKAKEVVPATLETAIHVSQQRSARLPFARRLNASGRSRCAARRRAAVGPAARWAGSGWFHPVAPILPTVRPIRNSSVDSMGGEAYGLPRSP